MSEKLFEGKRGCILNATIQLINEKGLSEISMSKIAKKAGVSASTIYLYFENKEDMLNKLYLSLNKKMSLEVFYNFDDTIPLKSAFQDTLNKFIYFIVNNKDYFLCIEQFSNSPIVYNLSPTEENELYEPLVGLFKRGKTQNVFKQVDIRLLYIFMFSPAVQYVKEHFQGQIELHQEELDELVQMSWKAIQA
ncbi:TetR/AcrR family transcriptional regulator [Paenibacillus sp. LS1]|uniref:TetR/AcrR family transcriptional regulator n=1 Tax=Paenibacillus sp. LS1 TaxID=2992120 RepID=UPI0022324504|nr:TetR/AcrR family transcriptional regulator [Paenibacillus sp. LS1]MCW3792655.1 TetR/AcrR family transcriptional regulator [Paenibacillus sp. LS1]